MKTEFKVFIKNFIIFIIIIVLLIILKLTTLLIIIYIITTLICLTIKFILDSNKEKKYKVLLISIILIWIILTFFYLFIFEENIPSYVHRITLDGDMSCLIDYNLNFGKESYIIIDNVVNKINITYYGLIDISKATISEHFWEEKPPDDEKEINITLINYDNYSRTWEIGPLEKTSDVKIYLNTINEKPNGPFIFEFPERKGIGCFRMNLYLNKYKCYENCLIQKSDNFIFDKIPEKNKLNIWLTSDEGVGRIEFDLHTYNGTNKKLKELSFLFLVPLIFLILTKFLEIYNL